MKCIPLFDSPVPGMGTHIANLVIGVHVPYPTIPTVSEWGLVIMSLVLVAMGTIVFAARRSDAEAA